MAELQGPPPARGDPAAFISSALRELATLRTAARPRQWQARARVAGVILTTSQWLEVDTLRADEVRVAAVSAKLYEVALAVDTLRQDKPAAWARLAGTDATTTCACVAGGRCGLRLAPGLDSARYQQCVEALPGLQANSWRREPDATRNERGGDRWCGRDKVLLRVWHALRDGAGTRAALGKVRRRLANPRPAP